MGTTHQNKIDFSSSYKTLKHGMWVTMVKTDCAHCGNEFYIYIGYVNRANKRGDKVYCSKAHSALGRRDNKTIEEKKKEKSEYDKKYREKNEARLRIKRHEWFVKDYAANPEKYRDFRKKKYAQHLAYLSTPEYKEWKKKYDKNYRNNKLYGEFAEAAAVLQELEAVLESKKIKYDYGITINKSSQKRKRKWQQTLKSSLQRA